MADATAISAARTKLHDALSADAGLAPWRVHRVTPTQIAAPCVYLDSVELSLDSVPGAAIVAAIFPVIIVVDGTVRPQIERLDDVLAHVWTAAVEAGGDPQSSRPVALDVGGPTLRAHALRVEMPVLALSMCAPSLVLAGGNP